MIMHMILSYFGKNVKVCGKKTVRGMACILVAAVICACGTGEEGAALSSENAPEAQQEDQAVQTVTPSIFEKIEEKKGVGPAAETWDNGTSDAETQEIAGEIDMNGSETETGTETEAEEYEYPVITEGNPEDVGISGEAFELISDIVTSDIEHGFTSAQLAVIRKDRLVCEACWGVTDSYERDGSRKNDSSPVTDDTLYDLASVTKMFSVNYALQKLVSDGAVSLDERIVDILGPGFADDVIMVEYRKGTDADIETQRSWKQKLTIRELLMHQGGFPADPRYFSPYVDAAKQEYDPSYNNVLFSGNDGSPETREKTLEAIFKTPLLYEPGTKTVYSDVDYMILGFVVEEVTGMGFDEYMKKTFYEPMGLTHITFDPLENGFVSEDCAATELNGNTRDGYISFPGIRTETLQGEVHDEKAYYCMGGVSGHAGLFSNAADLARLASVMLTGGYGRYGFFDRAVMDEFTAPKSPDNAAWGLGWYRQGDHERTKYFGTKAGPGTIGHQGWTGTLAMIDPEKELVIVLLTNKINSPVTDKDSDPNKFDGNWFTTAQLGFAPEIIYTAMDAEGDVTAKLTATAAELAQKAVDGIPKGAGAGHPAVRNAESIISVLAVWAERTGSEEYMELAEKMKGEL